MKTTKAFLLNGLKNGRMGNLYSNLQIGPHSFNRLSPRRTMLLCIALFLVGIAAAKAQTVIWTGRGTNGYWSDAGNWSNSIAPYNGASLVFSGTNRVVNTNDYRNSPLSPITWSNVTISGPGAFVLSGFGAGALTGRLVDSQPFTNETVLAVYLASDSIIDIVSNGVLTLVKMSGSTITKTGAGRLNLIGTNSCKTVISNGVVILNEAGLITGDVYLPGGTLDASSKRDGFTFYNSIGLTNGTFILGGCRIVSSSFAIADSTLSMALDRNRTNMMFGSGPLGGYTLTIGGTTNFIAISAFPAIVSYPTQFVICTGPIPDSQNFGLSPDTPATGSVSHVFSGTDELILTLTDGPKTMLWSGTNAACPTCWDFATPNWLFNGAPTTITPDAVGLLFDDTGTNIVNLEESAAAPPVIVNNNLENYTFTGPGAIGGTNGLTKSGSQSLTLANPGSRFSGGVTVNGGTLIFANDNFISGGLTIASNATAQAGNCGGTGNLPAGPIVLNGTLLFDHGTDLTVDDAISGSTNGTILKTNVCDDNSVLTLGGSNSFGGAITVTAGSLDLDGQNLSAETLNVSGDGAGGNGVIINNGSGQTHALRNVTLLGDTAIGGNGGRWDIRASTDTGTNANLSMNPPGSGFSLTKVGTSYVALVGVQADSSLTQITVKQGTLGIEEATTLSGGGMLTVSNGATLELFSNAAPISMPMDLSGDGVTTTVLNDAGEPVFNGPVTLSNNVVFGGNGADLIVNSGLHGSGGVTKNGTGRLTLSSGIPSDYSGITTVNQGSLMVNGTLENGDDVTVSAGAVLGGQGTVANNTTVDGGIQPGDPNDQPLATLTFAGDLTMNSSSNVFEVSSNANDQLAVTGTFSLTGNNQFRIVPTSPMTVGQIYTLATYFPGASNVDTNHISILSPPDYAFQLIDPATTFTKVQVQVTAVPQPPIITSIGINNGQLVLRGTNNNGPTPGTFHVLSSTNVALPLSDWTEWTNGSFDGAGNFSLSNSVDAGPRQFYIIQVP